MKQLNITNANKRDREGGGEERSREKRREELEEAVKDPGHFGKQVNFYFTGLI